MGRWMFRISWALFAIAVLIVPAVGENAWKQSPWNLLIAALLIAAIGLRLWVLYKMKRIEKNAGARHWNQGRR